MILFKAQHKIDESEANKEKFHKLIDGLTAAHIANIRRSNIPLVQRAFQFFDENNISDEYLVSRLKQEFQRAYCLSVNKEKEEKNYQILINTLEDPDNRIRAIFAVRKLDEGWDVLNLFDIVRCYTSRDAKAGKPGKTTIAEGKLIEEVDYDTGGISESVNYQGGGDFIYCELMPYNQAFMDKIQAAQSSEDLVVLWRDIAKNSFLNWYVNAEIPEDAVEDFIEIGPGENGLKKQKKLLVELLDKNQLYVNLSEIEDEDFGVSEEDKALNRTFYGE